MKAADKSATLALVLLLAGITCQVVGFLIYGVPRSPDDLTTVSDIIGSFLIFCFWFLSLLAWGSVLAYLLGSKIPTFLQRLLFGSAFGSITMGILGYVGLIGPEYENLAIIILVAGLLVNAFLFARKGTFSFATLKINLGTEEKYTIWVIVGICTMLLLTLANTFRIGFFWDPLWYHLTGPRNWSDHGRIFFDPKAMATMQASSWEYLFLWGDTLLSSSKGHGLIVGQLFGQWTHLFFGFMGTTIACYFFLKNFEASKKWVLLAVFAMMVSFPLSYVTSFAKNDWGIAFWTLGAFCILFDQTQAGLALLFASGIILGLALGGKITAVFTIGPLFLLWLYLQKKNSSSKLLLKICILASGAILGAGFIWGRNFLFTGNPFFPSMNKLFHSPFLGPTWERSIVLYEGHFLHFEAFKFFGREMLQGGTLLLPFFFFPLSKKWFSKGKAIGLLSIAVALSLIIFLAKVGSESETRILGTAGLLMAALSVFVLRDFWLRFFSKKVDRAYLVIFFLVLILGFIPWNAPLKFVEDSNPAIQIRKYIGGGALAWLRENLKEGESAVSLADTRLYYVSYLNVNRIWDYADLDRAMLVSPDSPLELTKILRKFGYTYLFNTTQPIDYVYDNNICHVLMDAIDKVRTEVVAFDNKTSYVVDLSKLEKSLESP